MCVPPTVSPAPDAKSTFWRTWCISAVCTLLVLATCTHPATMQRAHSHIEALHKIATDDESRRAAWNNGVERASLLAIFLADVRIHLLSPFLQFCVGVLALLSALVASDRLFHCYTALYWRYFARTKALERFKYTAIQRVDKTTTFDDVCHPTVVIQLPMFNETDVCQHVIYCASEIEWPRSKLLIQILDDSTCKETRAAIAEAVEELQERGLNVQYRWRSNRTGYKAGAMHEAMDDIVDYDYICIFDADFSPEPDFLYKTIPWIHSNPQCGFVQARWTYANESENLLTRVQTISLNYHIRCEQYARFSANLFFNFNGTAGVWRRTCIIDSGGWNHRTTVEDLDLSLRAYLRGWKFIFLDDVTCLNEIPAQYDAYRKQQHRWSAGPMQLWRQCTAAVWAADIPLSSKLYLNFFFFFTRQMSTHLVSFFFYCVLIPLCAVAPEIYLPFWALVYAPILVTLSTVAWTPNGIFFAMPYVLFENAMCIVKLSAMLAGLFELEQAGEWVVTTKIGKWVAAKVEKARNIKLVKKIAEKRRQRPIHWKELAMGTFFAACGIWGIIVHAMVGYSIFLLLQAVVFLTFGLNYVDGIFASSHAHAA